MVYLIHFDRPYHHARHYLGYTKGPVERRFERHQSGDGARLLRQCNEAGIGYRVVRVWEEGDQALERKLKRMRNTGKKLCPVCRQEAKNEQLRIDSAVG